MYVSVYKLCFFQQYAYLPVLSNTKRMCSNLYGNFPIFKKNECLKENRVKLLNLSKYVYIFNPT